MATVPSWTAPIELSRTEARILARCKKQPIFAFLRAIRHDRFDAAFQRELAAMYSDVPRGAGPHPPTFLAPLVLLQAYTRCSDFDAVSNAIHDARWHMVLDCLDAESPPVGETTLVDFRAPRVPAGMMGEPHDGAMPMRPDGG
jgi:transposase